MDATYPFGAARVETQPTRALDCLAAAVVLVDGAGCVTYANANALILFDPLAPVGAGLDVLLEQAGATGGAAVRAGLRGGDFALLLNLADGRVLDVRGRRLADSELVVSLLDISHCLQEAAVGARDPLTGLASRAALHDRLGGLLAQTGRSGGQVALLCVNLDRFRPVNEILGDDVGDALLAKAAERLRGLARGTDLLARLGGDEFALVHSDTPQPQGAEALAARIVDLLGRSFAVQGHMINIGASVGIAIAPSDGADSHILLQHATLAMQRGKAGGHGAFRFFQPDMDATAQGRRLLEGELRGALALKQFQVAYQPQISLDNGALLGFEALLRWPHPARGLVSPADFLPVAEESGLIDQIGAWVLATACRDAASWPDPIGVAINISPVQFRDPRLVRQVAGALAASGLAPQRLELEITEGVLLDDTERVLGMLRELKALGVSLALDDFGTGYSSLSYLQKFPFDKVKIDQSFVRGADQSTQCAAIIRAVAALGTTLKLKTAAEGVETDEQLARVRAAGCTEVQGYLTGRPATPEAAFALAAAPPPAQNVKRSAAA